MLQSIVNAVVPIAVTAVIGVLTAAVKAVGDAAVSFLERKESVLEVKIGADAYAQDLVFAKSAWNIVDEKFRITPTLEKTMEAKQAEFAAQIQKLVPGVTDDEIEQLRQAVAGEVNKGRAVVEAPAGDTDKTEEKAA
jgi:hypothetical protein